MEKEEILARREQVELQYGPWTAHKTYLGGGVYTTEKEIPIGFPEVVRLVEDFIDKPLNQLSVLDLASFEGGMSIEFAKKGANVLGIEGREANIKKAIFTKDILGLSNLEFIQDDVRNLSVEKYGTFDVVICSGILYHLYYPDCFKFIESISSVCENLLYLNTHFVGHEPWEPDYALGDLETINYNGKSYSGRAIFEHSNEDSQEIKNTRTWSSLDNEYSFWLTYDSLRESVLNSNFRSYYHCLSYWYTTHRGAFIALK
jgi:hypothetical protein